MSFRVSSHQKDELELNSVENLKGEKSPLIETKKIGINNIPMGFQENSDPEKADEFTDSPKKEVDLEDKKILSPKKDRTLCIDILRGVATILMVVVNAAPLGRGDVFYIFRHSRFDEAITLIDVGFPIFLFIVGYTSNLVHDRNKKIPLNFDPEPVDNRISLFGIKKCSFTIRMKKKNFFFIQKWFKIIRRTLVLFFLGVFRCSLFALVFIENNMVFGIPNLIPFYVGALFASVLQRIAICYFVVTVILSLFEWTITQVLVNLIIHMIYILLMFGIPYPCGLGRSGIISEECNAQTYFDGLILDFPDGEAAEYGIVTTLTAINTVYIGCLFYKIYKSVDNKFKKTKEQLKSTNLKEEKLLKIENSKKYEIVAKWCVFSFVLLLIGWFFNYFVYKISKVMWSTSFVFFNGGFSGLSLALIYFIVDILKYQKIFYVIHAVGRNSLFMYIVPLTVLGLSLLRVGHGMENSDTISGYIATYLFFSWTQDLKWSNLMFGICFECLFLPIAILFHYKKIYIKV